MRELETVSSYEFYMYEEEMEAFRLEIAREMEETEASKQQVSFLLPLPKVCDKLSPMMKEHMSNLPNGTTKTLTRTRAITNDGRVIHSWWSIDSNDTLVVDINGHSQYKKGTYRLFIEREVKTITYEEIE